METTPIASAAPKVQPTPGKPAAALSADFDTFLKMLTVQMRNQDPLNPTEATDFAVQLATFSGVEQQVRTNDILGRFAGRMASGGMVQMAGWIGMEARSTAPVRFDGAPVDLIVSPDAFADTVELSVTDAAGNELQRLPLDKGTSEIVWAGTTTDGRPLPPGDYRVTVVSSAYGEVIDERPAETFRRVQEVRTTDGAATLVFADGSTVSATEVTGVRQ